MVQQTVAEAFKLRILDLLTEFFAHAFRVLAALEHARTVAACAFQSVLTVLTISASGLNVIFMRQLYHIQSFRICGSCISPTFKEASGVRT